MKQPEYILNKLYALIDFIPMPILVFQIPNSTFDNKPHNIHYVNKTFTEILGYKKSDIVDHFNWFKIAFPDSTYRQKIIQEWQNNITKPLEQTGEYLNSKVKIRCKNNEERWFKIYTELRRKVFPGLYIVTFSDITLEMENNQLLKDSNPTDTLTKLVKKHYILKSIEGEKARVNRFGEPFSIIIAQVDNLIDIDENYGQKGVDYALTNLARIIKNKVRKIDIISRWDEDKFLILSPKTKADQAYKVNKIILQRINNFPFNFDNSALNISVTIGISEYQINENINRTIERAESALYLSKKKGKGYIIRPGIKKNYKVEPRFATTK